MLFCFIGENIFITFLADMLGLGALDLKVILEIFNIHSHSTTLWAGLHLLVTCMNVLKSSTIFLNNLAFACFTLELKCFKLLLSEPMHSSKCDSFISFAFFWAVLVLGSPWIKTLSAEKRITTFTLNWLEDNHGTNGTSKVVSLLTSFFITLDHVSQVESIFISNS